MIIDRERVLNKEEFHNILENMNLKKAIVYLSGGVGGLAIAKVVTKYSPIIDKFFFNDIGVFLSGSKISLMGLLPIPNWFILFCLVAYLVMAFATIYFNIKRA